MFEQDKRQYVRMHFERQVQLGLHSEVYKDCRVKDLSLGGIFVLGDFPCQANDQCTVHITLQSKEKLLTFQALAGIVRRDAEGIALKFISMPFASLVILELILLYEAPDGSGETEIELPEELPFTISEDDDPMPGTGDPL